MTRTLDTARTVSEQIKDLKKVGWKSIEDTGIKLGIGIVPDAIKQAAAELSPVLGQDLQEFIRGGGQVWRLYSPQFQIRIGKLLLSKPHIKRQHRLIERMTNRLEEMEKLLAASSTQDDCARLPKLHTEGGGSP